jgi:hypothetical protein
MYSNSIISCDLEAMGPPPGMDGYEELEVDYDEMNEMIPPGMEGHKLNSPNEYV